MPRKKIKKYSLLEALKRIKKAGIEKHPDTPAKTKYNELDDLPDRIKKVLNIYGNKRQKTNRMIYFIMYDIEDNKVRTHIAKYLINKGCVRIQKSVYMADTKRCVFDEIHKTLKEVQSYYDNHDSIFFVPISTDEIKSMKVVGQSIDFELFLEKPNTLFF